jgi:hypothetical protein
MVYYCGQARFVMLCLPASNHHGLTHRLLFNKCSSVVLRRDSDHFHDPSALIMTPATEATGPNSTNHVGQVAQLREAHFYSILLSDLGYLDAGVPRKFDEISSAEVQEPRMRPKRSGDEFWDKAVGQNRNLGHEWNSVQLR